MPVILDPGMQGNATISELLKLYDARTMRCYPVIPRINHMANDGEECSGRIEFSETQNPLLAASKSPGGIASQEPFAQALPADQLYNRKLY